MLKKRKHAARLVCPTQYCICLSVHSVYKSPARANYSFIGQMVEGFTYFLTLFRSFTQRHQCCRIIKTSRIDIIGCWMHYRNINTIHDKNWYPNALVVLCSHGVVLCRAALPHGNKVNTIVNKLYSIGVPVELIANKQLRSLNGSEPRLPLLCNLSTHLSVIADFTCARMNQFLGGNAASFGTNARYKPAVHTP